MAINKVIPQDKEWKIFEDNDGLIIANAFSVVSPEIFCVAIQFENEYRSMGEDYTRLLKYDHGQWSANDLDEAILSVVNLRNKPELGFPLDVNMLFLTREGNLLFIGENNKKINLYQKLNIARGYQMSLTHTRISGERLFFFGFGLIIEYYKGQWRNISFNLLVSLDDAHTITLHDLIEVDGVFYVIGQIGAINALWRRQEFETHWQRLEIPNFRSIPTNIFENDGKLFIFSPDHILTYENNTAALTQLKVDISPFRPSQVVFFKNKFYGISNNNIYNYTDDMPIMDFSESSYNKDIIFCETAEVFDGILYAFGVQGGIIKYDGTELIKIESPSFVEGE